MAVEYSQSPRSVTVHPATARSPPRETSVLARLESKWDPNVHCNPTFSNVPRAKEHAVASAVDTLQMKAWMANNGEGGQKHAHRVPRSAVVSGVPFRLVTQTGETLRQHGGAVLATLDEETGVDGEALCFSANAEGYFTIQGCGPEASAAGYWNMADTGTGGGGDAAEKEGGDTDEAAAAADTTDGEGGDPKEKKPPKQKKKTKKSKAAADGPKGALVVGVAPLVPNSHAFQWSLHFISGPSERDVPFSRRSYLVVNRQWPEWALAVKPAAKADGAAEGGADDGQPQFSLRVVPRGKSDLTGCGFKLARSRKAVAPTGGPVADPVEEPTKQIEDKKEDAAPPKHPTKPAKPAPKKQRPQPKKAAASPVKAEESKKEPEPAAKKEEPKKEEPKNEPEPVAKKEEPKKEEPKKEPEPKPTPKKAEPKKESEPKPAPEKKKPEPKPAPKKAEPKKAEPEKKAKSKNASSDEDWSGARVTSYFNVWVVRGIDLMDADGIGGKSDPYVKVLVPGRRDEPHAEVFRTPICDDIHNPVWPEAIGTAKNVLIRPSAAGKSLELEIWDEDTFNDEPMGVVKIPCGDLLDKAASVMGRHTWQVTRRPQNAAGDAPGTTYGQLEVVIDDGMVEDYGKDDAKKPKKDEPKPKKDEPEKEEPKPKKDEPKPKKEEPKKVEEPPPEADGGMDETAASIVGIQLEGKGEIAVGSDGGTLAVLVAPDALGTEFTVLDASDFASIAGAGPDASLVIFGLNKDEDAMTADSTSTTAAVSMKANAAKTTSDPQAKFQVWEVVNEEDWVWIRSVGHGDHWLAATADNGLTLVPGSDRATSAAKFFLRPVE